jgi:hypothetical protein
VTSHRVDTVVEKIRARDLGGLCAHLVSVPLGELLDLAVNVRQVLDFEDVAEEDIAQILFQFDFETVKAGLDAERRDAMIRVIAAGLGYAVSMEPDHYRYTRIAKPGNGRVM